MLHDVGFFAILIPMACLAPYQLQCIRLVPMHESFWLQQRPPIMAYRIFSHRDSLH